MKERTKESLKKVKWRVHDQILGRESVMLRNIYAQMQNERLRDDIEKQPDLIDIIKNTEKYKHIERIHKLINIKTIDQVNMKRIGRDRDGGYVMAYPLSNNNIAYSIGISDDVSWDKAMTQEGYDVYMYDHTIAKLPEQMNQFHFKKLGVCGGQETDKLKTLGTLIKLNNHENVSGMVLKMDVEGYEWDVLNAVQRETISQFDQIVIEMHDLANLQLSGKICGALERISETHQAIHIHANNFADVEYYYDSMLPMSIEVTYVLRDKYTFKNVPAVFPTELDRPCDTHIPEIVLGRWNY